MGHTEEPESSNLERDQAEQAQRGCDDERGQDSDGIRPSSTHSVGGDHGPGQRSHCQAGKGSGD